MSDLEELLRAAGTSLATPADRCPPLAERLEPRETAVDLDHLHLLVSDLEASARFYARWFGLAGEVIDGTLFARNSSGFLLCLSQSAEAGSPPDAHFGFTLGEVDRLRDLQEEMSRASREVRELCEEPGYASFRVLDPDGNGIEVFVEYAGPPSSKESALDHH